jgi:hypothetical protein
MKNTATLIGVLVFAFVLSMFFILPLTVHVIRDIAQLYHMDIITSLSNEFIYGFMLIIWIMKTNTKRDKIEPEQDIEVLLLNIFKTTAKTALLILVSWGTAYIVHIKF